MTTGQDRIVILKDGKLASHQIIQTSVAPKVGAIPGQPTTATECAKMATQFVPVVAAKTRLNVMNQDDWDALKKQPDYPG